MTITVNQWWGYNGIENDCYAKQSKNDKAGMKGDRSQRNTSDYYTPQGLDTPVYRPAGSLRLRRGDTKLTTLAKKYREFAEIVACLPVPGVTLATLRSIYGKAGITDLRKAVQDAKD